MAFINWLKIVIIGIIEGITEWLPISSTGHMILTEEILNIENVLSPEFLEMFRVVIQLGAIMAVVVLYWNKIFPFAREKSGTIRLKWNTMQLWFKIVVACLPAIIIGLPFDDKIDELFYNYITVAIMLVLYGVFFILVENRNKGRRPQIRSLKQIDYKTALGIGVFQVLALIPGTSRSGATILGGILLGTSRKTASEFTFFLAIPVMFGASLLKLVKFFVKTGFAFSIAEVVFLLTGVIVAFFVSIIAIKFLMQYIKKHDFKAFAYYRIVLGVIVFLYYIVTTFILK